MISQEKFDLLESEYGCGYWNVCWEHACPCAITTENKGLTEEIYKAMIDEGNRVADMFAEEDDKFYPEDDDYYEDEDRLPCGCCACCGCSCNDEYSDDFYEIEGTN
jgi:hypothetical protein